MGTKNSTNGSTSTLIPRTSLMLTLKSSLIVLSALILALYQTKTKTIGSNNTNTVINKSTANSMNTVISTNTNTTAETNTSTNVKTISITLTQTPILALALTV